MRYALNLKKVKMIAVNDIKNVTRDGVLLFMMVIPFIIILALRIMVPFAETLLLRELRFDLSVYYPFMAGFLLVLPPLMFGTIMGFILLDERDEGILLYLSVTPITKSGYLFSRIGFFSLYSFLWGMVFPACTGLVAFDFFKTIGAALLAAMETSIIALFLAAFAADKIEGMAFSKACGIFFIAPFIGEFLHSRWQLLEGFSPPYWITKVFSAAYGDGRGIWWYFCGGLIVHGAVIGILAKKFAKRAG